MTQRSVDRTTLLELIAQFFEFPTGTCCSQEYHGLPSAHQTQWEYAFICTCMRPCAWLKALTVSRLRSVTGFTDPSYHKGQTLSVLVSPCLVSCSVHASSSRSTAQTLVTPTKTCLMEKSRRLHHHMHSSQPLIFN